MHHKVRDCEGVRKVCLEMAFLQNGACDPVIIVLWINFIVHAKNTTRYSVVGCSAQVCNLTYAMGIEESK